MLIPPAPPNRRSLYTKTSTKKASKGSAIPSSSAARHEKCFKSPEEPIIGGNKYGTITLRKSTRRGPLCRSKSAGAVSSLLTRLATGAPHESHRTAAISHKNKQTRAFSPSSRRYSTVQLPTSRHASRSPVAFGRSISKERSFAEEKKRLENSWPLDRYTFEASTNILRDPSLKSPQDVKKAVRSLAACAFQMRSRSVPRYCSGCRNHSTFDSNYASRHIITYPEIEHYGYTEWIRPPANIANMESSTTKRHNRQIDKPPTTKQISKATSNVSLAGSNSTFSMANNVQPVQTLKSGEAKTSSSTATGERKICKKLAREASKVKTICNRNPKEEVYDSMNRSSNTLEESSCVTQQKMVKTAGEKDQTDNQFIETSSSTVVTSVRDKTLFWNDYNEQQATSLPCDMRRQGPLSIGHKSRSLSPNRQRLQSEDMKQSSSQVVDTTTDRYDTLTESEIKNDNRKFSPTREIRVPQTTATRNVRSPSRRRIEGCRSNQSNKVVRASSLSSAEDRSKRGLYLCGELAHSATSLASSDRHSPTCKYLHNSERFVELNRFYSTLERVGQLERATSKTDFKPIRKESDLLDYDEWRRVRLHERAEKELNYLVCKLKQDQQEKNLLFLPKDINDVKWRKEADLGLNSREKSVEDLRENFENINFLHDFLDQTRKPCCNMKYWRRNTVADLTHSLEGKMQTGEASGHSQEMPFNEQLVNALTSEQKSKISRQLNEIYSYETPKAQSTIPDQYVVTVEHHNLPASSQALKVRCKSSITRDELLGSILKRKESLAGSQLKNHSDSQPAKPTIIKLDMEQKEAPEIPPAPKMPYKPEMEGSGQLLYNCRDTPDITQKIKYFEERKYDKPPKTIYHAREDSSPDEDEVMRLIEEKMRLKQYRNGGHKYNELSTSLTDLCEMFGEKNASTVNFHLLSPQQRPPDEDSRNYNPHHHHHYHEDVLTEVSEEATPYSSLEFLESYCRSRSCSPQSQCSSYLQRVNTGDVQKIRDKFESLGYNSLNSNQFFGLRKLRKVRSDPELNIIKSESKDALLDGDVSWMTHKFEMHNKLVRNVKDERETEQRSVRVPRQAVSPQPLTNRLMPHIDRISKTAALGSIRKAREGKVCQSPTRSHSSSSGAVERLKYKYESENSRAIRKRLSLSSPDVRNVNECMPKFLTANWVAHRYPSPEHNSLRAEQRKGPVRKTHSPVSRAPMAAAEQQQKLQNHGDIFANQKFDPKIHQPKARYVPGGSEAKCQARLRWSTDMSRKGNAVTFQDYDLPAPLLPPYPKGDAQDLVSPNRYYESDVNIHFKTPVRQEFKTPLTEEELTARQAEHMQKLYQEERRRKYLQELQDMNSRRHTDNFTPSQKSPIALNRYDDFPADLAPKSINQIKSVARALYNFQAQNSKELSFKKGDIIYIRRAIDKNWYEGEHNAMIGLFPANYVEVINKEPVHQVQALSSHRKPSEGQARAKYNFQAQSGVELSLNKGELVALTRRVDDNWFEGRIANRKGIFPVSYVEVLTDIGAEDIAARTTTIQHVSTVNSRAALDAMRTNINNEFNSLTRNGAQAPNALLRETRTNHKTDILHVDTSSEPLVYRSLYKYRPQNSDELELMEGDIVHVLEKCDDGWYVGTSQRTGCFGTFPGNYVERI